MCRLVPELWRSCFRLSAGGKREWNDDLEAGLASPLDALAGVLVARQSQLDLDLFGKRQIAQDQRSHAFELLVDKDLRT